MSSVNTITIVGAGPTGLTLAWLYAKQGYAVTVLESKPVIGGCHSVNRVNGKFAEHGPRIYSSSFLTFKKLLKDIGGDFDDMFSVYRWQVGSGAGNFSFRGDDIHYNLFTSLTWRELLAATRAYIAFTFGKDYMRISVKDFMDQNNFTDRTKDYLDRVGLVTDGAKSSNYSMYKFLQLLNQEVPYKLYEPNQPMDKGLFTLWRNALEKRNVKIITNANVDKVIVNDNQVTHLQYTLSGTEISHPTTNIVLAIPPQQIVKLLHTSKIPHAFGDITKWTQLNAYSDFISVVFHWDAKLQLPPQWGFVATDHAICHIPMTNYFKDEDGTIISTMMARIDDIRNLPDDEIKSIAFKELKESYPDLPTPDVAIIGSHPDKPEIAYPAYIRGVTDPEPLSPNSTVDGLFTVGPHTNALGYAFTSIETAVASAYRFVGDKPPEGLTLNWIILFMLLIIVIIIIGFKIARHIEPNSANIGVK